MAAIAMNRLEHNARIDQREGKRNDIAAHALSGVNIPRRSIP
ncbi:hypothetical protein [Mesorhizobium retamae]|nr:hypothetical protein [Mesorhizobium sp. IRAMC:0171]